MWPKISPNQSEQWQCPLLENHFCFLKFFSTVLGRFISEINSQYAENMRYSHPRRGHPNWFFGKHFSVENSVLRIDSENFQSSPIFGYSDKFSIAGDNRHNTTRMYNCPFSYLWVVLYAFSIIPITCSDSSHINNDERAGACPNMNIKVAAYFMAYLHYNFFLFSFYIPSRLFHSFWA